MYQIVEEQSIHREKARGLLESKVDHLQIEGWEVQGSPVTTMIHVRLSPVYVYSQAMVSNGN